MGGKKKYIEMFGSFMEPFICFLVKAYYKLQLVHLFILRLSGTFHCTSAVVGGGCWNTSACSGCVRLGEPCEGNTMLYRGERPNFMLFLASKLYFFIFQCSFHFFPVENGYVHLDSLHFLFLGQKRIKKLKKRFGLVLYHAKDCSYCIN